MSRLQKTPSSQGAGPAPTKPSSPSFPSLASSLRTRRPSVQPAASKAPSFDVPTPRSSGPRKGTGTRMVSDKIKSRLSVRYADGPAVGLPSHPPPPVPALPSSSAVERQPTFDTVREEDEENEDAGMAGRGVGAGDMGLRRDPGQVDLEEIGQEHFDAETYLKTKLAGASDAEIQAFVEALEKSKAATSEDLQKNVFKNYTEFITISREIATLETSLLELQSLLAEWKSVPESLSGLATYEAHDLARRSLASSTISSSAAPGAQNKRSSVADLQSLYRTQLQALYAQVSGSQKFIPLIPGRHVLAESGAFVELNPATYRAKGAVHLFLLDDLVLVAGVRKRAGEDKDKKGEGEGEGRLVAEKCWMLAEVTVVDVKDSGELINAFKIRRGKETLIFRSNAPEDKRSLLLAFRKAGEELAGRKRRELEKEQEKRRTLWQAGGSFSGPAGGTTPPVPGLPGHLGSARMSASNSGAGEEALSRAPSALGEGAKSKDVRYVEEWTDEVTVALALKNWEEAVELLEEGKERLIRFVANESNDPVPAVLLRQRLATQQDVLLSALSASLQSPLLRKPQLGTLVSYYYRLSQPELARSTFLAARTDILKRRVGQIVWERGETVQYINELAVVWFMGVGVTAQWYLHAFRENGMASGLVKWSKEQIDAFAGMFREQVFTPNQEPAVIEEALDIVRTLSKKLLYDIGLDLTWLFRDGLIDRRGSASTSAAPSRPPSPRPPIPTPTPPPSARRAATSAAPPPVPHAPPPAQRTEERPTSTGAVPPPRPPRRDRRPREEGGTATPSVAGDSPAPPTTGRF